MTDEIEPEPFPVVDDPDELLTRQVHPSQIQDDGKPFSAAFAGQQEHDFLLSTRRASIGIERIEAEWSEEQGWSGSWGITVAETSAQGLPAFDDSTLEDAPEGHVSVDFRGLSKGQRLKKAGVLRDAAFERGPLS